MKKDMKDGEVNEAKKGFVQQALNYLRPSSTKVTTTIEQEDNNFVDKRLESLQKLTDSNCLERKNKCKLIVFLLSHI